MARVPEAPPLTRDRLAALLEGMRGRRVVVIGDAMLDRYLVGDIDRISPEAPVPVVNVTERRQALGGAANVAANVAALGAHAELVGIVGTDRKGETLRQELDRLGIGSRCLLTLPGRPTTTKTRVVARGQQVVRIDEEEAGELSTDASERLAALAEEAIATADVVLFEDYDKGALHPIVIARAMAAARGRGLPTVADPKFAAFFLYSGATVFKPNRRELVTAIPGIDLASDAELRGAAERLGVEHLLLTLGAEGMRLIPRRPDAPIHAIAAVAREVYDVSGAGDTVTAWAGSALAAGAGVLEAAQLANLAAGVEVGKRGVATVSPEEVLAAHRVGGR
ncbi:MAG: D-glycero-beta-D-manno-heptose-7-phosphate kinase [Gemmatimonadetes bacterium]|nr:D-glycero-beta-D-manno-heptose-7-phosphate kinase [Gemmatimonadota bacterium]